MTETREIENMQGLIRATRAHVHDNRLTFVDAPESFKDIESYKARIVILKNPNHYVEKYAALDAKRAIRYRGRKAC